MTYNVLADAYAHTWASLYPYLSAAAADPRARLPLAMQDILLASPEIVALQEVDRKWYGAFWVPQMRAAGYAPAGPLAEKTGLTREGCCVFVKAAAWRVVDAAVVSLKRPGPMPEEGPTAAFVASQPHLREALEKISTVGLVATLEPIRDADERRALVVANAHLFFHPGATHVRALQTRWLLRHAQKARETYARAAAKAPGETPGDDPREPRKIGLVVCGDFNAEPFDAAARFAAEGVLSAGDVDWALGSVFRWGGTSSRAAAAELASASHAPRDEPSAARSGSVTGRLTATHQKLGRMAACWRLCAEAERGERARCASAPPPPPSPPPSSRGGANRSVAEDPVVSNDGAILEDGDPFSIARHHARNGCTFKTCSAVAAWTFRRDAGMPPGVELAGVAGARWPGAEAHASPEPDSGGGGGGGPAKRAGMGPEWARGDAPASAPGVATVPPATPPATSARLRPFERTPRRRIRVSCVPPTPPRRTSRRRRRRRGRRWTRTARVCARSRNQRSRWSARRWARSSARTPRRAGGPPRRSGASAMHLRHPLRLRSACGDPEWTEFRGRVPGRFGLRVVRHLERHRVRRGDGPRRARAHASTRGGHQANRAA